MTTRSVCERGGCWRPVIAATEVVVGLLAVVPKTWASGPRLTEVSGSPFSTGAGTFPVWVEFSPDGLLATADANSPGRTRFLARCRSSRWPRMAR